MKVPAGAFLLVLLTACAADENIAPPGADQQFLELSGDYLDGLLSFRPVYATRLGIHRFDGQFPDYSPGAVEAEILRTDRFLQRLSRIPAGQLSHENLFDSEILEASMTAWLSKLTRKPAFKRDPLFYNELAMEGLEYLLRRDFAPAMVRMEALLSRLRVIPYLLEVAQINLTEVPEILRSASENPLVTSMYKLRESLPGRIRDQLNGQLPEGFEEVHLKAIYAYTDFILFVKDHLKNQTLKDSSIGESIFLEQWMNEELVDISLDTILELCASSRESVINRMKHVARLIDSKKSLPEVVKTLEENHETVKGVTDLCAQSARELKEFTLTKDILSLPPDPCSEIKILDPDPRTNRLLSILPPGILDHTCVTGYASINPVPPGLDVKERSEMLRFFTPYNIPLLAAGIAYPGNFVQALKIKEAGSKVRKVLNSATYSSGWAHYCEELIMEQGFDPRPEALLSQLQLSLLEINRLETSTRIHCQGMEISEAISFLSKESFITPCMAHREIVEMVRNPKTGAGFIGKAQITKLRDLYLTEDENRSLRHFHDLLLSAGQAPISVIANLVFGKQI